MPGPASADCWQSWHSLVCGRITPISASSSHGLLLSVCVSPLFIRTTVIGFRGHSDQYDLILTVSSAKTLFPNRLLSEVPDGCDFWGRPVDSQQVGIEG